MSFMQAGNNRANPPIIPPPEESVKPMSSMSGLISNPICPVCKTAGQTVIELPNYPLTEVY